MTGRRWGGKGVEVDRKRRKVREELGDVYVCHRLVLCQNGWRDRGSGTFYQTRNFEKYMHGSSVITSVVVLDRQDSRVRTPSEQPEITVGRSLH